MDLKDLGESLRERRSHKVLPVQKKYTGQNKIMSNSQHIKSTKLFELTILPESRFSLEFSNKSTRLLVAVENHVIDLDMFAV